MSYRALMFTTLTWIAKDFDLQVKDWIKKKKE